MTVKVINKLIKTVQQNPTLNDIKIGIYNLLNFHKKGNHKDIFIFASARGGSTLLEKIIASQPGIAYIFEPLHWRRFFTKRTAIQPDYKFIYSHPARRDLFKKYFEDIFDNRITIHFPLAFWRDTFTLRPERYVFKLINGKELINWFQQVFDIHVIYLLRHPIATALSRIQRGWKNFNQRCEYLLETPLFREYASPKLVQYAQQKLKSHSEITRFVTGWCIENYIPIVHLKKDGWIILSYEILIAQPETSLRLLQEKLDLPRMDLMIKQMKKPSSMVLTDFEKTQLYKTGHDDTAKQMLIDGWRDKVSDNEINEAFEILTHFEIDVYTKESSIPDVNKLYVQAK